jgi:carbamoylphosphate synthase small subunit
MIKIAVVDYDMGNLHSVCKGLQEAGAEPLITHDPRELEGAEAIVLPGVGSFDPAVKNIRDRDLEQPLKDIIATGKPFLGICLGLQILFDWFGYHSWRSLSLRARNGFNHPTHGLESIRAYSVSMFVVEPSRPPGVGIFCSLLLCHASRSGFGGGYCHPRHSNCYCRDRAR